MFSDTVLIVLDQPDAESEQSWAVKQRSLECSPSESLVEFFFHLGIGYICLFNGLFD